MDQRSSWMQQQENFDLGALLHFIKISGFPGNISNLILSSEGICGI